MSVIDWIILIGAIVTVALVIIVALINKKKGKTSCGCDCANCKGCSRSTKQTDSTKE